MVRRKCIDSNHTLISTQHFPYTSSAKKGKKALLGIGGNLGDTLRRFEHLFWYFKRSSLLRIVETAPILKNPPFGYTDQGDFYNTLMLIETHLTAEELLRYILSTEKHFGRVRLIKNGPRTLDIDMIFYDNRVINKKHLIVPHPRWQERDSVLIPLKHMKSQEIKEKRFI